MKLRTASARRTDRRPFEIVVGMVLPRRCDDEIPDQFGRNMANGADAVRIHLGVVLKLDTAERQRAMVTLMRVIWRQVRS